MEKIRIQQLLFFWKIPNFGKNYFTYLYTTNDVSNPQRTVSRIDKSSECGNMTADLYVSECETDDSWQLLLSAGFYKSEDSFHSCFFSFSNNTLASAFRCIWSWKKCKCTRSLDNSLCTEKRSSYFFKSRIQWVSTLLFLQFIPLFFSTRLSCRALENLATRT